MVGGSEVRPCFDDGCNCVRQWRHKWRALFYFLIVPQGAQCYHVFFSFFFLKASMAVDQDSDRHDEIYTTIATASTALATTPIPCNSGASSSEHISLNIFCSTTATSAVLSFEAVLRFSFASTGTPATVHKDNDEHNFFYVDGHGLVPQ